MKHIETVTKKTLIPTHEIGCGECQASCPVGNQACLKEEKIHVKPAEQDK